MNSARHRWLSSSQMLLSDPDYTLVLDEELMRLKKFLRFFNGDYSIGCELASELLDVGDDIALLDCRQFIILSYDLLNQIDGDTPAYVTCSIVRKFKEAINSDSTILQWIQGLDRQLIDQVLEMIRLASIYGWSDDERAKRIFDDITRTIVAGANNG